MSVVIKAIMITSASSVSPLLNASNTSKTAKNLGRCGKDCSFDGDRALLL